MEEEAKKKAKDLIDKYGEKAHMVATDIWAELEHQRVFEEYKYWLAVKNEILNQKKV